MKSEKDKMLAGELYNGMDPELIKERDRARSLMKQINIDFFDDPVRRNAALKQLLPNSAGNITVTTPFYCDYGDNIFLGEDVYLNFDCVFLDPCEIRVGARTLFAPKVQLYTATHPVDAEVRASGLENGKPITIGEDCWLGGGSIVLPGVTIGDRVVVGAGAVVTKDVPSDCIVGGNPARIIKELK